jgi:hypothetical protein
MTATFVLRQAQDAQLIAIRKDGIFCVPRVPCVPRVSETGAGGDANAPLGDANAPLGDANASVKNQRKT